MAERNDVTVDWGAFGRSSPRIIEVASPSVNIVMQDLLDSVRSNTQQSGEGNLDNIDDEAIFSQEFDPSGKTPTAPGESSGIILTMFNTKLRFEARAGPAYALCSVTNGSIVCYLRDTGSHTGANSGTVLIDALADFINFGIEEKAIDPFRVINLTDGSRANVVTVDSGTQITTDGLVGGSDNLFQSGDVILIEGYATSPIAPSAFTTVSFSSSVSPSIIETGVSGLTASESAQLAKIDGIEVKNGELHTLLGLEQGNKITITPTGIVDENNTIDIDFTGDGVSLTEMERQP